MSPLTWPEFTERLDRAANEVGDEMDSALRQGALMAHRRARANVNSRFTRRTGKLFRSVVGVPLTEVGGKSQAGVALDLSIAPYAGVHEGKGREIIRPRSGRYLKVPLSGTPASMSTARGDYFVLGRPGRSPLLIEKSSGLPRYVLKTSVTITQTPYMSDAFEMAADETGAVLDAVIPDALGVS